jgi:hypothetical protein
LYKFFLFQRTNYYFFLIEKLYVSYGTGSIGREAGGAIQLQNASQSKVEVGFVNIFLNENKSTFDNNLMALKKEH